MSLSLGRFQKLCIPNNKKINKLQINRFNQSEFQFIWRRISIHLFTGIHFTNTKPWLYKLSTVPLILNYCTKYVLDGTGKGRGHPGDCAQLRHATEVSHMHLASDSELKLRNQILKAGWALSVPAHTAPRPWVSLWGLGLGLGLEPTGWVPHHDKVRGLETACNWCHQTHLFKAQPLH